MRVVAVGSEPNTLVAALLLSRAGHAVQLLTGAHFGGVTRLMGNAPLDGRLADELGLELPARREGRLGLSSGGARVTLRRDEIGGQVSARDQKTWPAFVRLMDNAADIWRALHHQPADQVATRWRELGRRHALEVLRLPWHNLKDLLNECFESELLKATLASAALLGTRQGPFASGTAFLLLQRWARDEILAAAPPPLDALTEALLRAGVAIQKEQATRFEVADGKVIAVLTQSKRTFEADLVISGEDPVLTWNHRLSLADAEPEAVDALETWKIRSTTGTAGADATGFADFGVVSLTDTVASLEKAYDPTKYGRASDVPYLELEPVQQRVWVQHLVGEGCEAKIDSACQSYGLTAFDRLSPESLEREYQLTGGHLYGGDPVLWQSLWLRDQFLRPLPNLYLCGPGVGRGDYSGLNGARCAASVLSDLLVAQPS
jgi:phytoene dehydrogenase-like protein